MIFFALAALADVISTLIVSKAGGIEGNPLLRPIPGNLRWAFQVTAYSVAAALAQDSPKWVWAVMTGIPTLAATNNLLRFRRA